MSSSPDYPQDSHEPASRSDVALLNDAIVGLGRRRLENLEPATSNGGRFSTVTDTQTRVNPSGEELTLYTMLTVDTNTGQAVSEGSVDVWSMSAEILPDAYGRPTRRRIIWSTRVMDQSLIELDAHYRYDDDNDDRVEVTDELVLVDGEGNPRPVWHDEVAPVKMVTNQPDKEQHGIILRAQEYLAVNGAA